jgi:hypothetical protein
MGQTLFLPLIERSLCINRLAIIVKKDTEIRDIFSNTIREFTNLKSNFLQTLHCSCEIQ